MKNGDLKQGPNLMEAKYNRNKRVSSINSTVKHLIYFQNKK